MQGSAPQPDFGSEEFRKKWEATAREAMELQSGSDEKLVGHIVHILGDLTAIAPSLSRLRAIMENSDHPIFKAANVSPELREHMKQMRRAQLGALVQAIRVIQKTQAATFKAMPVIQDAEKKAHLDKAMRDLGLDV